MTGEQSPLEDASALLAAIVVETETKSLSNVTLRAARLDLLDTIGCALAGVRAPGVSEARDVLLVEGGRPVSTLWSTGEKLPPTQAAFANAMAAHALDFDDNHPGVLHSGVSVIPAAVSTAEAEGVDDLLDVLAATIVGFEVADRLAVATTDGPGVTGWLLTPLCGVFGAAAASARLLGLDVNRTRSALGLAYVQASGNGQSTIDGALAKRMQPAFAARGGIFAAYLAQNDLTGPSNAFEGERGYFHVYHRDRYDARVLRAPVGFPWMVERAMYKPYPCCAWTHTSFESGLSLRAGGLRADDIDRVEIGVTSQAYASTGTPLARRYTPQTTVDAQFSIPFIFATAVVKGELTIGDLRGTALTNADVLRVAATVKVSIDPELDQLAGRSISPARVVVHTVGGETKESSSMSPLGWEGRPVDQGFLEDKFAMCCSEGGVDGVVANEIRELILSGAGTGSAGHLSELLGVAR